MQNTHSNSGVATDYFHSMQLVNPYNAHKSYFKLSLSNQYHSGIGVNYIFQFIAFMNRYLIINFTV